MPIVMNARHRIDGVRAGLQTRYRQDDPMASTKSVGLNRDQPDHELPIAYGLKDGDNLGAVIPQHMEQSHERHNNPQRRLESGKGRRGSHAWPHIASGRGPCMGGRMPRGLCQRAAAINCLATTRQRCHVQQWRRHPRPQQSTERRRQHSRHPITAKTATRCRAERTARFSCGQSSHEENPVTAASPTP